MRKDVVVGCTFHNYILETNMRRLILENKVREKFIGNNECDNVANCFQSINTKHEIVDLREKLKSISSTNTMFYSFELTYVKNYDFYESLVTEMNKYHPLFYALTSHIKNATAIYSSLDIFNTLPKNTLLHLIANDLTRADVQIILKKVLDYGIRNIFVLRGDSVNTNNEFPHAVDLVRFIRNQFGNIFCICVAGYPEMHPESVSKEMDLIYLKEKVDAGADFIITQFFFEANVFIKFVNDCRKIGIKVQIIPGIYPISSYTRLEKMVKICNVKIPQTVLNTLEPIKNNDEQVYNYGVELSVNIIKDIIVSKTTCGFHLFTSNEPLLTLEICNKLDIFH